MVNSNINNNSNNSNSINSILSFSKGQINLELTQNLGHPAFC